MVNRLLRKITQRALTLVILASIILPASVFLVVNAQQGPEILSISVSSGPVGTPVTVRANITTTDGPYTMKFDSTDIVSGVAVGTIVNNTIYIPAAIGGNHTIGVEDDTTNAVGYITFVVVPSFLINVTSPASPLQFQEGDSVPITLNITGAGLGETIPTNVTVQTPNNLLYAKIFNATASLEGSNTTSLVFPRDFSSAANTSLVGTYVVKLNSAVSNSTFTVGLTNSTQYHVGQTVGIHALYAPGENVTLVITGKNVDVIQNLTADAVTGIVSYNGFVIPSDAQVNYNYMVNVTSALNITIKSPPDIQNFTIPGFPVNFTMNNLAGLPVSGVTLNLYSGGGTTNVTSGISGAAGIVALNVEIGTFTANATYKTKKVGDYTNITVTESTPQETLVCNLTSIGVRVTDADDDPVPNIHLTVFEADENTTVVLNNTDISGVSLALSLLPGESYVVNATRYTTQFNETIVSNLPIIDWFNISVIVPTYTLQLQVYGAVGQPLSGVTARASELSGGIVNETEISNGLAEFNTTLGLYDVAILAYGTTLNRTNVNLNQTTVNASIICSFYGLTITVKVVDYIGSPIANANVTLENGLWIGSEQTSADGTASFNNALGGQVLTTVTLPGQSIPYTMTTHYFDSASSSTTVSASRFLQVGGALVDVSIVATLVLIIASIAVIASIEVYKLRRSKARKVESDSENP